MRRSAWGFAINSDPSIAGERLIRIGSLLYVLGLLCLAAGVVGAVTGALPLWWGLLAASLCALAGHLLLRRAANRIIGPARTPEMKRAKKELVRRLLAGDAALEAELEAYLRERPHEAVQDAEAEPSDSNGS